MIQKRIITALVFLWLVSCSIGATWYVRPVTGEYGAEDGTSYAAAFDGVSDIAWGGISAGDTLYICGTFTRQDEQTTYLIVTDANGTSGNPITIRGDYGGDAGHLVSSLMVASGSFADEGDGSFSVSYAFQVLSCVEGDPVSGGTPLHKKASAAEVATTNGSWWWDDPGDVLWVNPTNGIQDCYVNWTSGIWNGGRDYITYLNINLYCGYYALKVADDPADPSAGTNVTIDGCFFKWVVGHCISSERLGTDLTITNCTFTHFKTGIAVAHANTGPDNLTITDNTFSGNEFSQNNHWTGADAGAIQVQNGDDCTIEGNTIQNLAHRGIEVWKGIDVSATNMSIQYNWIKNVEDSVQNGGNCGIIIGGDHGNNQYGEEFAGLVLAYNIVKNCDGRGNDGGPWDGVGIQVKSGDVALDADKMGVYNNVVVDCNSNYLFQEASTHDSGMDFKFHNNISLDPRAAGWHIWVVNMTEKDPDIDNNIYHPDTANGKFTWAGALCDDFADWKADALSDGVTLDGNSLTDDPLFISEGGDNFELLSGSPARDTGVDVGLTEDFDGTAIPINTLFDIGAEEYQISGVTYLAF